MKKIFVLMLLLVPLNVWGIETSAQSAILMDTDTHRILYQKNINDQRSVASISKIMTAVLAIESGKMDDIVTVGEEISTSYGSGVYIEIGEKISLRDLVYGLMLRSGNDASFAIAYYVGGYNFVKMMNAKAKEIGMVNTVFNNPNGLDEESGNYSTAYDMAILTSYAMKLDEYRKIVSTKEHIVKTNKKTYIWLNKNKLLFSYNYTTGGKTGFTQKAKRTLVTTASKDNLNLVAVTLNDGNDFADHKKLFEYGFNNYYRYQLLNKGTLSLPDNLYYNYDLSLKTGFEYTLHNDDKVYLKFELNDQPKEGNVGLAKVLINNKLVYQEKIYATKKVLKKKKSFWEKIKIW